jgi:hypothetical protein
MENNSPIEKVLDDILDKHPPLYYIGNMPELSFTLILPDNKELTEVWCGTKRPICQVLDAYKIPYPKDIVIYE